MITDPEYLGQQKAEKKIKNFQTSEQQENSSGQNINKFPQISTRLVQEAIDRQILPQNLKNILIRNPNNYSIFFTQFDCNESSMQEALSRMGMSSQDIEIIPFYQFSQGTGNTLENLIKYLYYITQHYQVLKELIKIKGQIQKQQLKQNNLDRSNSSNNLFLSHRSNNQKEQNSIYSTFSPKNSVNNSLRSFDKTQMTLQDKINQAKEKIERENEAFTKSMLGQQDILKKQDVYYTERIKFLEERLHKLEEKKIKQNQEKFKFEKEKLNTVRSRFKDQQEKWDQQDFNINGAEERYNSILDQKINRLNNMLEKQAKLAEIEEEKIEIVLERKNSLEQLERKQKYQFFQELQSKFEDIEEKRLQKQLVMEKKAKERQEKMEQLLLMRKSSEQENNKKIIIKEIQRQESIDYANQKIQSDQQKKIKKKIEEMKAQFQSAIQIREREEQKFERKIEEAQNKLQKDDKKSNVAKHFLEDHIKSQTTKNSQRFNKIQLQYAVKIMQMNKKADSLMNKQQSDFQKYLILKQEEKLKTDFQNQLLRDQKQLKESLILKLSQV